MAFFNVLSSTQSVNASLAMLKETSSVIFKHRVLAVLFAKAFFAVMPSPPRMIVLILLNEGTQDSSSIDVAAAVSSSS